MSKEQHEETVDGVRFRMVKLGGVAGRDLALRVMRMIGAAAASPKLDGASMLGALAQVTAADLDALADMLGKVSQMNVGDDRWIHLTRQAQDEQFAGRLKLQFGWLAAAVRYQLADFFG